MSSICGANCGKCAFRDNCRGCKATCGKPFGGTCIAAEYIKIGGKEKYAEFKKILLDEINALLEANGIPKADKLHELSGAFVNLEYPVPSGKTVKFLDDTKVYLGTQIEFADMGVCYGVVADTTFILICSYSVDGSEPELIAYKKR
ncbi:MAG: DUF3795 domain-containing protein [Ruminococcus sp.]|nr:DUF3795 domain-containing protein [Ruminococcus sp.]